jgi:uncharacterized membrane protein YkoI
MIKRIGALTAGLLLAWHPAFAASPSAPLWGYIGLATPAETPADVAHFGTPAVSVAQAMADVQTQRAGRVVEIGYAYNNGAAIYTALVAAQGGLQFLRVDPATGTLANGDHPDIARDSLDATGQRDLDRLTTAPVDLPKAVALVTAQGGGPVIDAGIEQLGGIPQYYVQTVAKGRLAPWTVDPQTGRVGRPE